MFRNVKIITLFFTMIVNMIGFGIIIPIMPFYIEQFGVSGAGLGSIMAVFSVMQFIASPYWGTLSDRYGRKKIMMVGVLGNAFSLALAGMASSYWMFFAFRAIGGLLSSATLPTAMAYISDSTSEDERGGGMGIMGAAMGVGMVLGPGIGGWLSGDSLSAPFFFAGAMALISFLMIALVLPESLPQERRIKTTRSSGGLSVKILWEALVGPLGFLLFLAFLVNFALASFEGIFGLYTDQRFGYGPEQVGTILMIIGIVSSIVQFILTGPATRRFGERKVILFSLISSALGFVLMVLAVKDYTILLTVGFFVFSNAMLRPAIMSMTSKLALGGQGEALGLNNAFQSLGRVAGPLWAGFTFDVDLTMPYLSGAVIMLITFLYAMWKVRIKVGQDVITTAPARVRISVEED